MYDSQSTGKGSVMAYREAMADAVDGGYDVHAILGAARSDASKPMSILGGIDEIPAVSYWSTSDQFDSMHSNFPYFSRTIPADSAVAKAAAEFFNKWGHKNVGIAYLDDAYGSAYKSAFVRYGGELGLSVQAESMQYVDGDDTLIKRAVDNLKAAGIKVGIVILSDASKFLPLLLPTPSALSLANPPPTAAAAAILTLASLPSRSVQHILRPR
jgi:ABC-type branched-subunit amino acid transport system substrate-binding protein